MNEKEIIKKINGFIDTLNDIVYDESDWYDYEELESAKEQLPVLEGILNLYNNLKEIEEEHRKENGELRVELKEAEEKNKEIIDGQVETIEKILLPQLLEKYIRKDKIRDKIKWYEEACKHLSSNGIDLDRYDQYQGAIQALQKLLED